MVTLNNQFFKYSYYLEEISSSAMSSEICRGTEASEASSPRNSISPIFRNQLQEF